MSIATTTRYGSGSLRSVTPRKPYVPLDDAELAAGRALCAELAALRVRHERELHEAEGRRNAWIRGMRAKYPLVRTLPSLLAAELGMHRTSVHAILSKGRNTRTRGGTP